MFDKLVFTPLEAIFKLVNVMVKTNEVTKSGGSLHEFTRATRVEPIVLLDQSVQHLPYIDDVMKTCLAMFSAYYLQAIALSVNVGKIDVVKLFDHLNPERGNTPFNDMRDANVSMGHGVESISLLSPSLYKRGLPNFTKVIDANTGIEAVSFDQDGYEIEGNASIGDTELNIKHGKSGAGLDPKDYEGVKSGRADKKPYEVLENSNLVVGNLLDVQIESCGHKATIPIMVRLLPSIIRTDVLVHILSKNERNVGILERFHELRSGQIKFVNDLIFCQDLIDEHRKTLMKDKSGQYAEIMKRRQKNREAKFWTGKKSVADASNMVIMSESTSVQFEAACGGRLKDFKTRQRVFESTYLMLLIVIDTEWEQATIYHRGIALPTQVSVKSMKSNNKKGVDVGEVLKAYQLGNNHTF